MPTPHHTAPPAIINRFLRLDAIILWGMVGGSEDGEMMMTPFLWAAFALNALSSVCYLLAATFAETPKDRRIFFVKALVPMPMGFWALWLVLS